MENGMSQKKTTSPDQALALSLISFCLHCPFSRKNQQNSSLILKLLARKNLSLASACQEICIVPSVYHFCVIPETLIGLNGKSVKSFSSYEEYSPIPISD